ncbi:MAG: alpha/beta hydrolase fold protein [Ilumatobacteraceae bacterium]|nr:alpha/beta hydrolase fold protein [Ilumatobacteraceae bacterium]
MTAVFVHGNPETPIIWQPLLAELGRTDVICPHLPGFGRPAPAGFGATKEEYVHWLIGEVEAVVADSGPVDLVGHDWGGGLAMRLVATRPELVRSWACDVLGLFHPAYVWHDFAQIWQTPGAGEEFFEQTAATPDADRVALYESLGIPADIGARLVEAGDAEMGRCVLALYRSAVQPALIEWGKQLDPASTRPGLAIIAPNDPFVRSVDLAPLVAQQLGAKVVEMEGQGHWWMLGDPAQGARALNDFWASL